MPPESSPPPPPDPRIAREQAIADNTRAESELNRFIATKQDALFVAPDAFYRTQGADAIRTAPFVLDSLSRLNEDALDGLANDAQRRKLGPALDAHLQLTRDDIARHVSEQSKVWQRQTALDRIALLTKEAAYRHNDDGLIDAIGTAAGSAARAHARVGDQPPDVEAENAAAAKARSGILSAAIQARLGAGNISGATALFDRVQDQLDPTHARPLQAQLGSEQRFDTGSAYAGALMPVSLDTSADGVETGKPEIISDASPEPVEVGKQYAQAEDERHKAKDDPVYLIKKLEHTATPQDRIAHGDAPLEVVRPPPISIPLAKSPARAAPTPGDAIPIGKFAGESIPARSSKRNFNKAERADGNRIGYKTGCHTCGSRDPGTPSGNFYLDHQPASRLNFAGVDQRLYPQCMTCSARQGGQTSRYLKEAEEYARELLKKDPEQ